MLDPEGVEMNEITAPTDTSARIAALRARIAGALDYETWQPEPGELLVGEYTGYREIEHPRYGKRWVPGLIKTRLQFKPSR